MTSTMMSYHVDVLKQTYDNILTSSTPRDRKRRVEDSYHSDRTELEELYVEDNACDGECGTNNETLSKMVNYLECKSDHDASNRENIPCVGLYSSNHQNMDSEDDACVDDTSSTASSRSTSSFKKSKTFKDLVLLESDYILESIDMGALYV
jgi:hypothetical protein